MSFRSIRLFVIVCLTSFSAFAGAFTPGNIVVYRVGDGGAALTGAATPVFLDEYNPTTNALVQSIALPAASSPPQRICTAAGNSTTEGFLSRSPNGLYLAFGCYDAAVGTATPNSSTTIPRVIGRVDGNGAIDTTTSFVEASSAGNPRTATTSDGNRFWVAGSTVGVRTTTLGSSAVTNVSTTNTNLRQLHIYNGQLYVSSGAGATFRLGQVGTGLPTASGTTTTNLPGLPVTNAYNSFFFADLDAGVAGVDTLYIADETAGAVNKWALVSGTWTARGSVALTTARGLAGVVSGSNVTLYAVGGTANLVKLTDTSGYNTTMTGTFSTIATVGVNRAFRGVALTPLGPPTVLSSNRTGASPTNATSVAFTVTFDQDVTGVDVSDFTATTTGATSGTVFSVTPVSASVYTVTVNLSGGDGTIRLDVTDDDSITSTASGLPLGGTGAGNGSFASGQSYTIDRTVPAVQSIARANTNPTSAASVDFTVTFTEPVIGVDTSDFTLATSGLSGATITGMSGGPGSQTYTVSASTGTGTGTLRLDVVDNDSISDATGNVLGGPGAGNGNFNTGEVYDVDRNVTTVQSIVRASTNPTNATTLLFTVTFTTSVNGVDTTDFAVTSTGTIAGTAVSSVTPINGSTYTVTVTLTSGQGTVRLDLVDNDTITGSSTGIPLGGNGAGNGNFTTGESYTVDVVAPTVQSFVRVGPSPTNAATVNYTLTFNEAVSGVDSTDFAITSSGGSTVGTPTTSNGGLTWTVPINTGGPTDTFTIKVADDDTIVDSVGNKLGGTGAGNGDFTSPDSTDIDKVAPLVSSITRASANPSGGPTVDFTVTFSEGVSGVDASDFALTTTGSVSGTSVGPISGASGSSTYTVTVNTGGGSGTLRLDVSDDDTIVDAAGNKLGGTGTGNGNFTTGEAYTLNQPIAAPSNLVAGAGDGKVVATWNTVPGATSYNLKRALVSGGPYTTIAPGLASATFTDTAVTNGTRYYYVVTAVDATSESSNSAESRATPNSPAALGLVISQVYGAGGNTGAVYTNDFIEVFNRGTGAVNVNGWSVQYISAGGTGAWAATPISGQILPGRYYLVQETAGTGGTTPLPAPDANGGIAMSGTAGKVALVSSTSTLTGCAPSSTIADFVGYGGTASCAETSPTPNPSANTNSLFRALGGCKETQNNNLDFANATTAPRNSATALNNCGLNAVAAVSPSTVPVSTPTLITADVLPASAPPSTGITVTANLTPIGGSASQALVDDGTSGDATSGDGIYSFSATVGAAISAGTKTITVNIADAQARAATTAALLTVTPGVETIAAVKVDASPADTIPDRLGQVVQVRGFVSSIDFNGGTGIEYFIQDATGGIDVFSASAFGPFTIGTQIEVTGTITQFNGLTEITPSAITTVGSGAITPLTVTLAGVNESLEGQLVRVDNLTTAPATFAADTNYVINDGTAGEMRIDGDTNLVGQSSPPGIFSLIGLVGQRDTTAPFDSGYQILPRSTADIIPRTSPTGLGSSNPPSVAPGEQSLLMVTVTLGQNPPSTGVTVVADLTLIGGSATQTLFDDGTNGDVTPADGVYSYMATVAVSTSLGPKTLPVTISDAQARGSATSIPLNIQSATAPPTPLNLVATPGNSQVSLTWSTSTGATGYNVKRATVSGGPYTTIAPNHATNSYTDIAVVNGTRYYYVVSAENSGGESGDSAEASALPSAPPPSGSLAKIYFVDIGQGAGTLIVSPTGKTLLVDGGPNTQGTNKIIPLLNTLGIATIDFTILTHYHIDHDGGLIELINAGKVVGTAYDNGDDPRVQPPVLSNQTGQFYTSYVNALAAHSSSITRQTVVPGTVIDLGGGMRATFLAAGGTLLSGGHVFISNTDLNSESISTLVEFNNFDFIISGDLTGGGSTATAKTPDVETYVSQMAGDVDFAQLDHHGSTTANGRRFLNALKAEASLASAGATNTFGHPNRETANKYLNTPATDGNTYAGTGIPAPMHGPVFYQTDASPAGDSRCTLQGYSGADLAHAGLGTILLKTDGTVSFSLESFDDGGARLSPSSHVYALDGAGAGVTTNFPPTVIPNVIPAVPLATDAVTIEALVNDREDPITSVTLNYSLNGAAQAPVMMTVSSPDVFSATITAQPNGTRVDYTVTAVAGGTSTSYSSGYFSGTTPVSTLRALTPLGEPLYLDYAARVQGVVTSGTGNYSAANNDDYLDDGTAALNIFRTIEPTSPPPQSTTTGTSYSVAGVIGQNLGRFRLEVTPPFDGIDKPWATTAGTFNPYTITSVGSGAVTPLGRTIAQINAAGESLEAKLVQVANCTVTSGTIPASDNGIDAFVTISDGTGSMQLKIDHDSDIPGLATPTGSFTATGIIQQDDPLRPFDTSYSLTPRNRGDLGAASAGPPLITIAEARADVDSTTGLSPGDYVPDRLNQSVKIRGTVTSIDFRGGSGIEIYIQDATAGVDIFNTAINPTMNVGDSVEIVGTVKQFNGLTEIDPGTLTNIVGLAAGTTPAISPQVVTCAQLGDSGAGEPREGSLIRINNVTLAAPPATFGANTNYVINEGPCSATIRIDGDTNIDGTAAPTGTFSLIGVLGQFDNAAPFDSGYQLLPRSLSDFLPPTATPAAIAVFAGSGQSAVVNTAFGAQLQARVTDSGGAPIEGVNVTFNAPSSGASGTFPGSVTVATVATDASGIATAPVFTANGLAGPYSVTATINLLTATFNLTNVEAAATHFSVTAPATATVGVPFNVTVTALNSGNATVMSYSGTVHFTSTGAATLPADYTFSELDGGTHTFSVTLNATGTQTITVSDTSIGSITGSADVNVAAGAATHYSVTAPASVTNGVAFNVTVTARDLSNAVATSYAGTVHFTSSSAGTLPVDYTFMPADNGVHTFSVTLTTNGSQTITATDLEIASITGSTSTNVAPVPATHFGVSAPATVNAGVPFNVTVTALDASNAVVPTYNGTIHFTSSSAGTLPADYTFVGPDSGTHTFSVTLTSSGSRTISVSDGSISGTANVTVNAVATHFSVSAPATVTAGTPFSVTVSALDSSNAVVTTYTGTVHFTSSSAGTLPADYTYVGADNGTHTFNVTLTSPGSQSISVSDGSISGTTNVTVNAVATHLSVSAPATVTAGTPFNVTVSALDAANAVVTTYTGTVHFTSSSAGTLPADYTFTAGDNGSHTFSVILTTTGAQSITVSDGSINGTANVTVNPAPVVATHLGVSAPATATTGVAFNVTVTALDASNAVVTGYRGTVHFTSSSSGTLPADYMFTTADNGIHTFSATLTSTGAQTINVSDGSISGSASVTVNPPAATHFSVTGPGTATAGVPFNVTVTALDASNAVVTGYRGTVHFTSSSAGTLPADYTFTAADNGIHTFSVTLTSTGAQTIDVSDGSISGSAIVTVNAATPVVTHLSLAAPSSATVGVPFTVTVSALDSSNAVVTSYTGTVHFASSGPASLPPDYTFTSVDAGSHSFSITLNATGTQTITVNDGTFSASASISASCGSAGGALLPVNAPAAVCANSSGNVASVAAGAATYSWQITNGTITAGQGTASITFTAGANGDVAFSVAMTNAFGCAAQGAAGSSSVRPLPTATIPALIHSCGRGTVSILVTLTGTAPFTFTWSDGVQQTSLSNSAVRQVGAATKPVRIVSVSDASCSSSTGSSAVSIIIDSPPVISLQPQDANIHAGETATLVIAAAPVISYQWFEGALGDETHPVSTEASFTTPPLQTTTMYWAKAMNRCDSTSSRQVTVTIVRGKRRAVGH